MLMTSAYFEAGCEISHTPGDCRTFNSNVVKSILNSTPPQATAALLKAHTYKSAFTLFRELSIIGQDNEVDQLADSPGLHAQSVASFAVPWYLAIAKLDLDHDRAQDGVDLYKHFAALLRPRILAGEWISEEGLDATDLPVLTDVFCPKEDLFTQNACIAGVLEALDAPYGSTVAQDTGEFARAYAQVLPPLHSDQLSAYLRIWTWSGSGTPPPTPAHLNKAQLAAWHYAVGARQRRFASQNSTPRRQCLAVISQSRKSFSQALTDDPSPGYFKEPAQDQLNGLREQGDSICDRQKR
jgi:hypothetical protein